MKSLENHSREDRANRSIWGWLQRDKLSSAWLQVLPGPDTSMSSAEFSEAAASALCILLPACLEKLGQVIRCRQVLDLLDETQQAITIESDTMPLSNVPTCFQSFTKESIGWRGVDKSNQLLQICGSLFPRRETLSSKISTHAKDSFHLAFFPPRPPAVSFYAARHCSCSPLLATNLSDLCQADDWKFWCWERNTFWRCYSLNTFLSCSWLRTPSSVLGIPTTLNVTWSRLCNFWDVFTLASLTGLAKSNPGYGTIVKVQVNEYLHALYHFSALV